MEKIIVNYLLSNGYSDLELQHIDTKIDGLTLYNYFGYTDDYVVINVYVKERGSVVEVWDCYVDEEQYSRSLMVSLVDLLNNY